MIACKIIKTHNITSQSQRFSGMNVKAEFQQSPLLNPESKQSGIVINFDNSEQNKPLANRSSNFCARDAIARHRP